MDWLMLEAIEFKDPAHWTWRLSDPTGATLLQKRVSLDTTATKYEAFVNLHGYLRWRTRRGSGAADETRLVGDVGEWIGRHVLGDIGSEISGRAAEAPQVVRVRLTGTASALLDRPLELAYVDGRPLALTQVTFVYETAAHPGSNPVAAAGPSDRLRMLAVFSLPTDEQAIGLRRERQELEKLIRRSTASGGPPVDLRVVQYGTTRARLEALLKDDNGWDLIHVSGHGLPGGLKLELPDGRSDKVGRQELVRLLRFASARCKLVTLSACDSAAGVAQASLRQLGLPVPGTGDRATADEATARGIRLGEERVPRLPTLAATVASGLGCAVLAMRYPVDDEFAVRLTNGVYERLLGGQPLASGFQQALQASLNPASPTLSAVTPALFGARAADLVLTNRTGQNRRSTPAEPDRQRFPSCPEHFAGRVGVLLRASTALAPLSGKLGVLLHGIAGVGKTACALELANTHGASFASHYYYAMPRNQADTTAVIRELLISLAGLTGDPRLLARVRDTTDLIGGLHAVARTLNRQSALLVLENLECLMGQNGDWLDERCAAAVEALTSHRGTSRVIMTSRRPPSVLDPRIETEQLRPMSLTETMLMARWLPNLRPLIDGSGGMEPDTGRRLVARLLNIVQGLPALILLADRIAADPTVLADQVSDAETAWEIRQSQIGILFQRGTDTEVAAEYLAVLARWTLAAAAGLPGDTLTAFWFLACLEEADRQQPVLNACWPTAWHQAGRTGSHPPLDELVAALTAADLVLPDPSTGCRGYSIHPIVADTAREECGPAFRHIIDSVLGAYWMAELRANQEREAREVSGTALRAARRAVPYLLRLHDWPGTNEVLRRVIDRDTSPGTIDLLLPLAEDAVRKAEGTRYQLALRHLLARAHALAQPREPTDGLTALFSELLKAATTASDMLLAAEISGDLADLMRRDGRFEDALTHLAEQAGLIRRAGLGQWSQAENEVHSMVLALALGQDATVFDAARGLLRRLSALPSQESAHDPVAPWKVREALLAVAVDAADNLGHWGESLVWTATRIRSMERRGAPDLQIARARYEACFALLYADFVDEARQLALRCREVFERERDVAMLGLTLGTLARIEERAGRLRTAIEFAREAVHHACLTRDAIGAARGYDDLAEYLEEARDDQSAVFGYRLAGAVVRFQLNLRWLPFSIRLLARDLTRMQADQVPPSSISDLTATLGPQDGADFGRLVKHLPGGPRGADSSAAEVMRRTLAVPEADLASAEPDFETGRLMYGAVASAIGDAELGRTLQDAFATRGTRAEWKSLLFGSGRDHAGAGSGGPAETAISEIRAAFFDGGMARIPDVATSLVSIVRNTSDPGFPKGLMQVGEAMLAAGPGQEMEAACQAVIQLSRQDDPDLIALAIMLRRRRAKGRLMSLTELTAGLGSPDSVAAVVADCMTQLTADLEEAIASTEAVRMYAQFINAVVAEASGDVRLSRGLADQLAFWIGTPEWDRLARIVYRILHGERSRTLTDGLDTEDTAIVSAILDRLSQAAY